MDPNAFKDEDRKRMDASIHDLDERYLKIRNILGAIRHAANKEVANRVLNENLELKNGDGLWQLTSQMLETLEKFVAYDMKGIPATSIHSTNGNLQPPVCKTKTAVNDENNVNNNDENNAVKRNESVEKEPKKLDTRSVESNSVTKATTAERVTTRRESREKALESMPPIKRSLRIKSGLIIKSPETVHIAKSKKM